MGSLPYPRLYVGETAKVFKYKNPYLPVYQLYKDNIREFIEYYSTQQISARPLVIEDIYYLPESCQTDLLKFVEETQLKVVLLSSYDNIIPALLSRMAYVYKEERIIKTSFLSPSEARKEMFNSTYKDAEEDDDDKEQEHQTEIVKRKLKLSPMMYYNDSLIASLPNKQKLLNLLESDYVSEFSQ